MSAKTDYYGNPLQAITDIGQHQAALEEVARLKGILKECLDALMYLDTEVWNCDSDRVGFRASDECQDEVDNAIKKAKEAL